MVYAIVITIVFIGIGVFNKWLRKWSEEKAAQIRANNPDIFPDDVNDAKD